MNKVSSSKIMSDAQDEWDRISQNPDNVIVSDVLRDTLADYYAETPTKSQRAVVTLRAKGQVASMRLMRFEQSPRGWALVCVCSTQTAYTIMRLKRDEWTHADIKIGDDLIRDFKIDTSQFRIEVEVPTVQTANSFECTVNASCVVEQTPIA